MYVFSAKEGKMDLRKLNENGIRDYLFTNKTTNIFNGLRKKEIEKWVEKKFPPISFLLKQIVEKKINKIIDDISYTELIGKEIKLERLNDSVTRIDLLGNSETAGVVIIELKKSTQTERQSFTELLAYANHFCTLFPGLKENTIHSVLISPMDTRIARDSYMQELVFNNKNIIALIPEIYEDKIEFTVYYPESELYDWFENNIFDDASMLVTAIEFPELKDFIDTDLDYIDEEIPQHSKEALNTISSTISQRFNLSGYHTMVYATQKWGEIASQFPNPNIIFIVSLNPYSSLRANICDGVIYGESDQNRIASIKSLYDQINSDIKDYYLENLERTFHDEIIRIAKEEFENCFLNNRSEKVPFEISCPNWSGIKESMLTSVFTYNLDLTCSGIIKQIYMEYIKHVYNHKIDYLYYADDLPHYSFECFNNFLAVWEIINGIGIGD